MSVGMGIRSSWRRTPQIPRHSQGVRSSAKDAARFAPLLYCEAGSEAAFVASILLTATSRQSAYSSVLGQAGARDAETGAASPFVVTVDKGHPLSEHADPLRSVHANRVSGAAS